MKLLIADKLPDAIIGAFQEARFEVEQQAGLKGAALVEKIATFRPQVLIVRSTEVPRAALEAGPLGLVIRAGAGFNNVDCDAASQLGIYVANCPGKNAIAVAELTWGLIISIDRRIPHCTADLRAGRWNKKEYSKARGLYGRTLGLIGVGEIGRQVAARAQAFGMPVVAWSRSLTEEKAAELGVRRVTSPLEVARAADVVSVHVALTPETKGMIDAAFFAAMRPGAYFVNTSRGKVVDAEALRTAVAKGRRCGLDVWSQQPEDATGEFADPLGQEPSVVGTHHIGASTDEAQDAVAAEALRVALAFKRHGEVPNCVNLAQNRPAPCTLVVRHRDVVGVLAGVLGELKEAGINVQEMENVLFSGEGAAACATIRVNKLPAKELLERLTAQPAIINVEIK
ncbi:MAG: NAD(P)-dependent oxidoreductase [Planctomycetota bacterium]